MTVEEMILISVCYFELQSFLRKVGSSLRRLSREVLRGCPSRNELSFRNSEVLVGCSADTKQLAE